jgi:uncharacterized membrane protein YqiK
MGLFTVRKNFVFGVIVVSVGFIFFVMLFGEDPNLTQERPNDVLESLPESWRVP